MKLVRYFFVGGAAGAVDIGVFTVAVKGLGFIWFFVTLISFALATLSNCVPSIRYVLEISVGFKKRAEVSLVFLVSGVVLVINQSVLWLLIETAGIDKALSKLIAAGTVFLFNYTALSRFIFKALQ